MTAPFLTLLARLGNRLLIPDRSGVALLETLGLSFLFIGLGVVLDEQDPFGLYAPFPWGWFAPTLLALRHGTLAALCSVLILAIGQATFAPLEWGDQRLHVHMVGGLTMIILLGGFSGAWRSAVRREKELSTYLKEQMQALTNEHYLLCISYDRLKQELLLRPGSLSEALGELERHLCAVADTCPLPEAARLLQILGEYTRLISAALYPIGADGLPIQVPAATLGQPYPLDLGDALIRAAIEDRQLCHVAKLGEDSRYLVAAPVLSSSNYIHALLVVSDMPFLAFEHENLLTIDLILLHYADMLERDRIIAHLLRYQPACPPDFAFALHRLWRTRQVMRVTSHIVSLRGKRSTGTVQFFEHLLANKRVQDVYWLMQRDEDAMLHIVLPLGSRQQAEGLLGRVEILLREQYGVSFEDWYINPAIQPLDRPPQDLILHLLLPRLSP